MLSAATCAVKDLGVGISVTGWWRYIVLVIIPLLKLVAVNTVSYIYIFWVLLPFVEFWKLSSLQAK